MTAQELATNDSRTINPSSNARLLFPASATGGATYAEGVANNVLGADGEGDLFLTGDSVIAHGTIVTNNRTDQILNGGIALAFTGPLNDYDQTTNKNTQPGPGNLHPEVYGPSSLTSFSVGFVLGGITPATGRETTSTDRRAPAPCRDTSSRCGEAMGVCLW